MQEVYRDGSEGEKREFNSLEEMLPELEKSLNKKNVKFIKVFRIPERNVISTEEVNRDLMDDFKDAIDNEKK